MELPKLKKTNPNKKTMLLLSDDLRLHSGIGTMSREIVVGTSKTYNWFQLGAAIKHPEKGKIIDVSEDINKELGITDANVRIMPWSGYGDSRIMRKLMDMVKPDAIIHFTDPRFWQWLYHMEHEIRQQCPIIYYAIWDDTPFPDYNITSYGSCDMILGISKQSHNIHNNVLKNNGFNIQDISKK